MEIKGTPLYSWQAPEFKHHPKGFWWYVGLTVIAVLLAAVQIRRQDYFGAAITGIIALLAGILTQRKPDTIDIHLTTEGVHVRDIHIPFRHIKQFWVLDDGTHKTLNLETSTYMNRWVILELHEQDAAPIREFLVQILPEHPRPAPTFSQWLAHKTKF